MEITEIEPIRVDGYLFVRVHTDEGVTGLGEAGTWAFVEAAEGALERFERYLVGKDPLAIEHHWQAMYRNAHFRGAAIMGALSAVDVALWDIAGKHHGVPSYELLGGPTRTKARAYPWVLGETTEELVVGCRQAVDEGFTAVGHLNPLADEDRSEPYSESHVGMIESAKDRVRRFREAVGPEVDLCIEIHRRLDPGEAVVLSDAIEEFRPMFFEDPTRPDNLDAMERIAANVSIPIATGERLHTIQEFQMLLDRDAVEYVRPDVCLAGGLTQSKKIAALAEANYVDVVPHNPLSPVGLAASLQLAATIPNFAIQEYMYEVGSGEAGRDLVVDPIEREDGYLVVPDRPGIGIELDDEELARREASVRDKQTRLHEDGSVVDQ